MAATLTVREGRYGPDFFDDLFKVEVSDCPSSSYLLPPDDFPLLKVAKASMEYTVSGAERNKVKRMKIDNVLSKTLERAMSFRERVKSQDSYKYPYLVGELNGYRMLILRIDALATSFLSYLPYLANPRKGKALKKNKRFYCDRMQVLLEGKKQLEKLLNQKPRFGKSASQMLANWEKERVGILC